MHARFHLLFGGSRLFISCSLGSGGQAELLLTLTATEEEGYCIRIKAPCFACLLLWLSSFNFFAFPCINYFLPILSVKEFSPCSV